MKSALQHAMRVVEDGTLKQVREVIQEMAADASPPSSDRPSIERAAELLAEADAAHEAEAAAEAAEREMRAAAAEAALKRSQALADAHTVVARALSRAGQDLASWPPAAALAAENIATLLLGVQNARPVETDQGFGARSSEADIAKGAAVGAVLAGG